ncbi:MAG: flavin reductase family protein [Gemmatimonadaceae bacterium]
MPIDSPTFRSVLGRFPSGVTVVTAQDQTGEDHGMTASAFCSLSLQPPLVLLCVERSTDMHPVLESASRFVVNVLSSDQEPISRRFAERLGDKFEGVGYSRGMTGAVILDDVHAFIECSSFAHYPGGDHSIFVGEVLYAEAREGRPLLYYRGGYTELAR